MLSGVPSNRRSVLLFPPIHKSSIDQEIDKSSAPSTHNYEVAQKEDETKISTIKTEPVADNTPIPFQLV